MPLSVGQPTADFCRDRARRYQELRQQAAIEGGTLRAEWHSATLDTTPDPSVPRGAISFARGARWMLDGGTPNDRERFCAEARRDVALLTGRCGPEPCDEWLEVLRRHARVPPAAGSDVGVRDAACDHAEEHPWDPVRRCHVCLKCGTTFEPVLLATSWPGHPTLDRGTFRLVGKRRSDGYSSTGTPIRVEYEVGEIGDVYEATMRYWEHLELRALENEGAAMRTEVDVAINPELGCSALGSLSSAVERKAAVERYLLDANLLFEGPGRLYKTHYWRAAGYTDRTEFQAWQSGKGSPVADRRFREVLSLTHEEFFRRLKSKRKL